MSKREAIIKKITSNISGIKSIDEYKTDSSHSIFLKIKLITGKDLICKVIEDTALAGSSECAKYEYEGLALANSIGIAPKPIFFDLENSMIISEFIESVNYDCISVDALKRRAALAGILARSDFKKEKFPRIHCDYTEDFNSHYNMLEQVKYAEDMENEFLNFKSILKEAEHLCTIKKQVVETVPEVLSHNDLVGGNVLKGANGKYYMIDFETVGISKVDYVIGQLAVDAEIDCFLFNRNMLSLKELYTILSQSSDIHISYELFYLRVLERLSQNAAYGFRQIYVGTEKKMNPEYIKLKRRVTLYCISRLNKLIRNK